MSVPIPAWQRAFTVAELRDMVFKIIACPRTFCRLQRVSHELALISELATTSLYDPRVFASHFFSEASAFVSLVRDNRAIMAGSSIRQFMYEFKVGTGWLVIMANERSAEAFTEFVMDDGYKRYDTRMFEQRLCRRPLVIHRFTKDDKYVTVHFAVHEPLRLLLATTRPFALQACDGWRFVDFYPRLGQKGPPPALSHGHHTHLLDERECAANLPKNTFSMQVEPQAEPAVSFVERWVGDGNTWIAANKESSPSQGHLERHGWTIRLFAQRLGRSRAHYFWTDTTSRCLRHDLLTDSYVVPPPALVFATRVLDRMKASIQSQPDARLIGPGQYEITGFDEELRAILQHYRDREDYIYTDTHGSVAVSVEDCTYEIWAA